MPIFCAIAPTFGNDSTSETLNFTPNLLSTATMKLIYAKESQLGTSSRLVSMVSTIESSDKRSRRIRVNSFSMS